MSNFRNVILHPALFIPLLLLLFLGTAVLAKIFVWPTIKKYQAGNLKEEAAALVDQGNYRNAFIQIRKAIMKDPDDLESYQIALTAVENSKEHIQYVPGFLQKLMEMEPDEPDHFNKFILITLQIEEFERAKAAFANYPEHLRDTEDYHQIGFSLGQRIEDYSIAEFHMEKLREMKPDDPDILFTLSTLRLESSEDENKITESKRILASLAETEPLSKRALRALLAYSLRQDNSKETHQNLAKFSSLENLSLQDRLLELEARISIDESGVDSRIDDFLSQKITNPSDVVATLDFLIKHELLSSATNWIEGLEDEQKQHREIKRRISQVYYNNQDWARLKESLLNEDWEDQEFGRLLMLAITSKTENDPITFRKYWERCLMEVRGNRDRQKILFQTTVELNWKAESIEVLDASFNEDPTNNEVFNGLTNHLMSVGKTAQALEVLARRVDYVPDDNASKNNFALLSLLTGINESRAFSYARDNFAEENENPYFTTTWAFALQKQGRNQEAVNLLEFLSEDEKNDPQRAVYISKIYLESGDREKAIDVINRVDKTSLYAEELNLYEAIQRELQGATK